MASPSVHDHLSTPFAVLDADALEHNLATMARWCTERGVELMPHGKTTMAPSLFERQLAHGATGITAATPAQVRLMREFGVPAIQLASQLAQPREAAWIAGEIARGAFAFSSWVDSVAGVEFLDAAGGMADIVFDVLLEIGIPNGRTGCRTESERAAVTDAVRRAPNVRLAGVAGYEGVVAGRRDPESMSTVHRYLSSIRAAAEELLTSGAVDDDRPLVLTAGGSMFFDAVVDELATGWTCGSVRIVLRSGCYVVHDHGLFHQDSPLDGPGVDQPLRPALTVWGTVLSRPQPDRAFLDAGRRNVSFDQGLPTPLARLPLGAGQPEPMTGATVTKLNDQHAFVELDPSTQLDVGDRVQLGISHPCTTFDKWRLIPLVRDGRVIDTVSTYF
ncbi:alanine racemase [Jiangella gansuensis]|uniref:alanine racemase n=1 Tax=Jiangella gansuensis TaxID=281473 RepID=UPI0004B7C2E9|nr:alanine racemase [Jiangella gansuensis]